MSIIFRNLVSSKFSSQEILKHLISEKDSGDSDFSLAALCRKAKFPSKGLLSDVLNGRRRIPLRHARNLSFALGLSHLESDYFEQLVRLEQEKDERERCRLQAKLDDMEKSLDVAVLEQPGPISKFPFAFEVFCAFGLFKGEPSRQDLLRVFGKSRFPQVDQALHKLQVGGFIKKQNEKFTICGDQHVLFENDGTAEHSEFVKTSILDAAEKVSEYFDSKTTAFFESVVLSVKKTSYKEHLKKLREESVRWQSGLEASEADMLVRYNVQVYPLGSTK